MEAILELLLLSAIFAYIAFIVGMFAYNGWLWMTSTEKPRLGGSSDIDDRPNWTDQGRP